MKKRFWILDIIIFLVFISLGIFVTLVYEVKPLVSMFFFFVGPTIYMLFNHKFNYKKIFLTSGIVALFAFIFDVLVNASKGWLVPDDQLFIPWRFLGYAPLEEGIWFFSFFLFAIVFYEYFVERDRPRTLSKNFKWLIVILGLTSLLIYFLLITNLLTSFKYIYLIGASVYMIPPLVYVFIKRPLFIRKFFYVTVPFFFINMIHELTALKVGQWIFPGEYIGEVIFFGLAFPFEEFLFYIVMGAATGLAYYELFSDDMK